ncbi:hypothetical protein C7H85_08455 [Zobellella endophytica]|uniref:Glycine zipper 2TM domain-containing protein n=1 Tax=Zobellella endophytica TaxID=2116700 RepID=A0A2P7R8T4_9GAMM|nr:hypothetical protein [Zobellella endophytica]PSJ46638.1 hypothetical protein C7H85_08455 [Zobellella endophytica]
MFKKSLVILSMGIAVAGCQSTGEEYQANVFDASQVNTQQEAKTIEIVTVTPTKIKVSNEQNKKAASVIGGLLGAAAGAGIGSSYNSQRAVAGGAVGGIGGALAGSLVSDTSLVDGVLIGYADEGKIFTSAQVGRVCEFEIGKISLMVKTMADETRIQPNAACPESEQVK